MSDTELVYPKRSVLAPLYTTDKGGKERVWKIWTVGNEVRRIQGLVDGKKQSYTRTHLPKNVGRSNETTAEEQAGMVAQSLWFKQVDKGYRPTSSKGLKMLRLNEEASLGGHNVNSRRLTSGTQGALITDNSLKVDHSLLERVIPMKAQVWDCSDDDDPSTALPRVLKHFDFDEGVTVQAKLDGWRCIARLVEIDGDTRVILTSNSGKQYPWFEKLRGALLKPLKKLKRRNPSVLGIDGELYCHSITDNGTVLSDGERFQNITSICSLARKNPHPLEDQIELIAFDIVDTSGTLTQFARTELLEKVYNNYVETYTVHSLDEVTDLHTTLTKGGYEGIILRAHDLTYISKRAGKMRKYKGFKDREYEIAGAELEDGVADHYFVWVCHDPEIIDGKTGDVKTFKVTPMNLSEKERRRIWRKRDTYIGKQLTVKYQELTKDRIPRFPKGVSIRDDY